MKHRQCILSDLEIDMNEVFLSLGYKNAVPDNDILQLINNVYAEINTICKPQYIYKVYNGNTCGNASIEINNTTFETGKMITHYLYGMEKCCIFATTAGIEYDTYKKQLREKGDIPEEFIADAIGSVIAEACVNALAGELAEAVANDYTCTYPYSPGYCNWKLTEQPLLFSLLPDTPCGITLTESCLMVPIKSITGIIGIGKNIKRKKYACDICEMKDCFKRKKVDREK
jgi:hypothetical protein